MRVRSIVVCLFRRGDQILVMEVPDTLKGIVGYRPLGGGIEHGEYSTDAVRREIREELGVELTGVTHLGVTENIFTYMGKLGHEIVFVYEADAAEPRIYEVDRLQAYEDDGSPFEVVWKSMKDFNDATAPLYPEGLLELLIERWSL